MATHHEVTDHVVGEMDTRMQEKTFHGFIRMCTWVVVLSILVLIFLALSNS